MSKTPRTPIVAIVGRTNAGKSSLLNAVTGAGVAIIAREAGTTRDNVWQKITDARSGKSYWLIDTAGMKNPEDEFEASIQSQIQQAVNSADLIVLCVDSSTVLDQQDLKVIKLLHKQSQPVIAVLNKSDKLKGDLDSSFKRLKFDQTIATSCTQKTGIDKLRSTIASNLPLQHEVNDKSNSLTLAFIGRPNTGKSSLFNSICGKQQALVSSQSGTTRDINRAEIRYKGKTYNLLDTSGIKRSSRTAPGIEKFSLLRTIWAIENSDICALTIDATEPAVNHDQKIAGMIKSAGKGLVLTVTKWDLLPKDRQNGAAMLATLGREFSFVPWASVVFTSAEDDRNVNQLLEITDQIATSRSQRIDTKTINRVLSDAVITHPPSGMRGKKPRLKYIVQRDNNPPSFTIYGHNVKYLHPSYKNFLSRCIRDKFGYEGSPIKLYFEEN